MAQLSGAAAPNARPIAVDETANYARGGSVQIPVLANDLDDAADLDPASLVLGTPLHGSVSFDPGTGVVTYDHDGSATPKDWFSYSVQDGQGLVSNTTSVQLIVSNQCGDGIVSGSEACDDENVLDGDCCSSSCQFESAGSSCSDGDACSDADGCDGAGACVPGPPLACDDGLFCNGAESCDPQSGCQAGSAPVLDDGVGCTVDACDEVADTVTHTPDHASCDDLVFCNGVEVCDLAADCQPGTPPALDDGVACTVDSCDEGADQVVHAPDEAVCMDLSLCTADSCDAELGCVNEPIEGCEPVPATGDWGRTLLVVLYLAGGVAIFALRRRDGA
jgi:cysteine-rich repeat protein